MKGSLYRVKGDGTGGNVLLYPLHLAKPEATAKQSCCSLLAGSVVACNLTFWSSRQPHVRFSPPYITLGLPRLQAMRWSRHKKLKILRLLVRSLYVLPLAKPRATVMKSCSLLAGGVVASNPAFRLHPHRPFVFFSPPFILLATPIPHAIPGEEAPETPSDNFYEGAGVVLDLCAL